MSNTTNKHQNYVSELDNMVLPVDDSEPTTAVEQANVAAVEPTVFIQGALEVAQRLEVVFEDVGTAEADLSARIRFVQGGEPKLVITDELHLGAEEGRTDVTGLVIAQGGDGPEGCGLGQPVELVYLASKRKTEEINH